MVIRNNFFIERIVKHLNRLLREIIESSSLEEFKRHGHGTKGHDLMMGLGRSSRQLNLMISKVFSMSL